MKQHLATFKLWLAKKFRMWAEQLETPHPVYQELKDLAWRWKDDRTVSGQYKRHQVYAEMLTRHPDMNRKDLGLLIERVVQTLP